MDAELMGRKLKVLLFLLSAAAIFLLIAVINGKESRSTPLVKELDIRGAFTKTHPPLSVNDLTGEAPRSGSRKTSFTIPERYQFPGVSTVDTGADSLNELLRGYTDHDREIILEYYGGYSKFSTEFHGSAQLQWMAEHGYPMPEDILAAYKMDDEKLAQIAELGNVKAAYFMLDRNLASLSTKGDMQDKLAVVNRMNQLLQKALVSGTPFAGYLQAKYGLETSSNGALALAGYNWARQVGDLRAEQAMLQESAQQGVSPAAALAAYSALEVQTLAQSPELLNPRLIERIPPAQQ